MDILTVFSFTLLFKPIFNIKEFGNFSSWQPVASFHVARVLELLWTRSVNHTASLCIRSKGILIPTRHCMASTLLLNYLINPYYLITSWSVSIAMDFYSILTGLTLLSIHSAKSHNMMCYRCSSFLLRAMSSVESSNMAHRTLLHHSSLSQFQGTLHHSLLKVSAIKISPAAGAPPAWFHMSHTAHTRYENHKCMCVQVEK